MISSAQAKSIKKSIKIDARGLGIPSGAAEIFADKAIASASKSLRSKKIITDKDLNLALAKEFAKYSPDLAYVHKNRDTII